MGIFRAKARLFAVCLGLVLTVSSAWSAPKIPRLSERKCKAFMDEIMQDTDEDLALLPYIYRTMTGIYGTLNAPGLDEDKLIEAIVASDIRGLAFKLEGMGRALKAVDKTYFSQIARKGEDIENLIGDYTFETELYEFVKQPEFARYLTPKIEVMFEGRIAASRENLVRNLRREGWTGEKGKAYREIVEWLELAEPVNKKSKLKKKLLNWMADHLEETHAKILNKELDPKDIEGGLHKMRRLLREVAILILSFDGMFYLDDALKVDLKGVKLTEAALKNRFVPNESDLLKRAVGISKNGFLYLGQLITDFGALKARDGMKEYVFKALEKAKKLGPEAKLLMDAVDPKGVSAASFKATRKKGAEKFQEILDTEILLQLARQFREAADEF